MKMRKRIEQVSFALMLGGLLTSCTYMVYVMILALLHKVGWSDSAPATDLMESNFILVSAGAIVCGLILTYAADPEFALKRRRRS